jgi:hypothetical protein
VWAFLGVASIFRVRCFFGLASVVVRIPVRLGSCGPDPRLRFLFVRPEYFPRCRFEPREQARSSAWFSLSPDLPARRGDLISVWSFARGRVRLVDAIFCSRSCFCCNSRLVFFALASVLVRSAARILAPRSGGLSLPAPGLERAARLLLLFILICVCPACPGRGGYGTRSLV